MKSQLSALSVEGSSSDGYPGVSWRQFCPKTTPFHSDLMRCQPRKRRDRQVRATIALLENSDRHLDSVGGVF